VPGLSALAADPAAFRTAARHYLKLAALAGLGIAVMGWFVAGPITTIPFGDRWADAVPAVRVVALSALPILVSYVAFTMYLAMVLVVLLLIGPRDLFVDLPDDAAQGCGKTASIRGPSVDQNTL
jgi:O-antigen/teichoic acid export membrane protein